MALSVQKGISAPAVTNIPKNWDAEWFRSFITNYGQNMDVRNAVAGAGISITGTVLTPATVSVSTQVQDLFHEPYVLATAPTDTVLDHYRVIGAQSGVLTVADGGVESSITVGVAPNGIGNAQIRQGATASVIGNATDGVANVADIVATADGQLLVCVGGNTLAFGTVKIADTSGLGDSFTTSGLTAGQVLRASGATTAAFAAIELGDLPAQANNTVLGNISGGSAAPSVLTQAQLTTLVNVFTASLSGAVPSGATAGQFLGAGGWAAPAYPTGANPSATYGVNLVGANGSAPTWLRSDAVLKLDPTIAPTWTGQHTFNTASVSVSAAGQINTTSSLSAGAKASGMGSGDISCARSSTAGAVYFGSGGSQYWYYDGTNMNLGVGGLVIPGGAALHGNSVPAQVTGWGTPTGASVQSNFSGSAATLVQCSAAIAEIITSLKAFGLFGA